MRTPQRYTRSQSKAQAQEKMTQTGLITRASVFSIRSALSSLAVASAAVLSACGGQAYRTGNVGGEVTPQPNPTVTVTPNPSPTPTDAWVTGTPPIELGFSIAGSDTYSTQSQSVIIQTDNLLQVAIRAGTPNANSNGVPYTPPVNCVSYKVTLVRTSNGTAVDTRTTKKLLVPGGNAAAIGCEGAVDQDSINFSALTGAGINYAIKISDARYNNDAFCNEWINGHNTCLYYFGYYETYWYGDCLAYKSANRDAFCFKPVVPQHTMTGELDIYVN